VEGGRPLFPGARWRRDLHRLCSDRARILTSGTSLPATARGRSSIPTQQSIVSARLHRSR
jgi:hypothetical protein